ncbi:hypothetical protein CKCBHOJB_02340 [Thauera sp. GDN1]|uniref:DUF883 family protein n=1 Tax=Thauera sp. GDN1 TaxID=2944810 RepID=UPI0024785D74|nr:DUF883 domain-containing protein [Thauera sp. GDN1]WEN42740.1 hypothetical protein CKCBHOJB_02340 [Thauera sp. GDN1]
MTKQTNVDPVLEVRGQVVQDLKGLVTDVESLLKEVLSASGEEINAAGMRIDDRLGEAKARLVRARVAASKGMGEAADITQAYVVRNPWKVLGGTALAGLIIGAMLRSR